MKCLRIECHLTKTDDRDKINKTIVAFNKRYHFHGIVRHELMGKEVVAVYLPEGD